MTRYFLLDIHHRWIRMFLVMPTTIIVSAMTRLWTWLYGLCTLAQSTNARKFLFALQSGTTAPDRSVYQRQVAIICNSQKSFGLFESKTRQLFRCTHTLAGASHTTTCTRLGGNNKSYYESNLMAKSVEKSPQPNTFAASTNGLTYEPLTHAVCLSNINFILSLIPNRRKKRTTVQSVRVCVCE